MAQSGSADRGGPQVTCPECGGTYSSKGLHGHLRFEHDYSTDQASRTLERAKEGTETTGEAEGGSGARDTPPGGLGGVSEHVRQRLEETADTKAALAMIESLDDGEDDGEDFLDKLEQFARVQSLLDEDDDDGADEKIVRELAQLRGELSGQAGGGGSEKVELLKAGLEQGYEPDELAALTGGGKYRLVDSVFNSLERLDPDTVSDLVSAAVGGAAAAGESVDGGGLDDLDDLDDFGGVGSGPDETMSRSPAQQQVDDLVDGEEEDAEDDQEDDDDDEEEEVVTDGSGYWNESRDQLIERIEQLEQRAQRERLTARQTREQAEQLKRIVVAVVAVVGLVLLLAGGE